MSRPNDHHQRGFALILSLLALVLLTTMGLALSSSTGTELQISTNHRWSEAARYNAEAGIEYGRSVLLAMPAWTDILPPVRGLANWETGDWEGEDQDSPTSQPILGRATRDFENWKCDAKGYGMGYGLVLDDGGASGPEEFRSQVAGAALNGAFTIWVRRPVMWAGGNGEGSTLRDYAEDDVLILVSEGVAPYAGAANNTGFAAMNRASHVLETLVSRMGTTVLDQSQCSSRQGQAGGGGTGGNTSGCVALTAPRHLREGLAGVANLGDGDLK